MMKKGLNSIHHQTFGEMAQEYYQKFCVFVFVVFEQSGRDTIHVSIERKVDDPVVQPSLQEWGHCKYFVQLGERLLIESDH